MKNTNNNLIEAISFVLLSNILLFIILSSNSYFKQRCNASSFEFLSINLSIP